MGQAGVDCKPVTASPEWRGDVGGNNFRKAVGRSPSGHVPVLMFPSPDQRGRAGRDSALEDLHWGARGLGRAPLADAPGACLLLMPGACEVSLTGWRLTPHPWVASRSSLMFAKFKGPELGAGIWRRVSVTQLRAGREQGRGSHRPTCMAPVRALEGDGRERPSLGLPHEVAVCGTDPRAWSGLGSWVPEPVPLTLRLLLPS